MRYTYECTELTTDGTQCLVGAWVEVTTGSFLPVLTVAQAVELSSAVLYAFASVAIIKLVFNQKR